MRSRIVHLFVFDGMADWEASYAVSGVQNPQFQMAPARYRVVTVAANSGSVVTMGGVRIEPDARLDDIAPSQSSMLILPGGEVWERGGNAEAIGKTREFIAACVPVAAICGATWALARAGLLDNRYHTSNDREYLASSRYRGGRLYREVPAICDQGVITASGVAPIEFACEIFSALDVYDACALDAWYALFKYGATSQCFEPAQCSPAARAETHKEFFLNKSSQEIIYETQGVLSRSAGPRSGFHAKGN